MGNVGEWKLKPFSESLRDLQSSQCFLGSIYCSRWPKWLGCQPWHFCWWPACGMVKLPPLVCFIPNPQSFFAFVLFLLLFFCFLFFVFLLFFNICFVSLSYLLRFFLFEEIFGDFNLMLFPNHDPTNHLILSVNGHSAFRFLRLIIIIWDE